MTVINPNQSTRDEVERREHLARSVLETIRESNIGEPRTGPTFTIAQAAELVGRTPSAIRMAEAEGRLPEQARNAATGRRENYTLEQVDRMREVFDTRPWRKPGQGPIILPVQNFKGGVGKSTLSIHLAQYLAMRGYRVLLIDADAQASTTMMFGYIPDTDFGPDDSLLACLRPKTDEDYRPLSDLVLKTHYYGLDLVPANLNLYNIEYLLASLMSKFGAEILTRLRSEIMGVSDRYDVVILDPPPALGMISLSALYSANALLIPMPPNIIDFASTTAFLSMLAETMATLEEAGLAFDYGFIQIVINRGDESKLAHREIVKMANMVFGRTIMETEIKSSAEFDNCTSKQQSVYDLAGATTNHHVRKRCREQLDSLNGEVEKHMRAFWQTQLEQGGDKLSRAA